MLDGIDVFVEVVDAGSFTRAARRFGMPATTVSARIARLEARLGVTLIQRTTRQLHITPAGRAYYERCARALAEITQGERELTETAQEVSGLLRITAPADLAGTALAPVVDAYLSTYPKSRVELVITNARLDLLAEGIDLAVRASRGLPDSSLVVRRFITGRLSFWAAASYLAKRGTPRTLDDLEGHDFVRFAPAGERLAVQDASGTEREIALPARLVCDDLSNVRSFVERGLGIGLLPDFMAVESARPLQRLLTDYRTQSAPVLFVYPAQRYVPRTVRAFMALAMGEQQPDGPGAARPE